METQFQVVFFCISLRLPTSELIRWVWNARVNFPFEILPHLRLARSSSKLKMLDECLAKRKFISGSWRTLYVSRLRCQFATRLWSHVWWVFSSSKASHQQHCTRQTNPFEIKMTNFVTCFFQLISQFVIVSRLRKREYDTEIRKFLWLGKWN